MYKFLLVFLSFSLISFSAFTQKVSIDTNFYDDGSIEIRQYERVEHESDTLYIPVSDWLSLGPSGDTTNYTEFSKKANLDYYLKHGEPYMLSQFVIEEDNYDYDIKSHLYLKPYKGNVQQLGHEEGYNLMIPESWQYLIKDDTIIIGKTYYKHFKKQKDSILIVSQEESNFFNDYYRGPSFYIGRYEYYENGQVKKEYHVNGKKVTAKRFSEDGKLSANLFATTTFLENNPDQWETENYYRQDGSVELKRIKAKNYEAQYRGDTLDFEYIYNDSGELVSSYTTKWDYDINRPIISGRKVGETKVGIWREYSYHGDSISLYTQQSYDLNGELDGEQYNWGGAGDKTIENYTKGLLDGEQYEKSTTRYKQYLNKSKYREGELIWSDKKVWKDSVLRNHYQISEDSLVYNLEFDEHSNLTLKDSGVYKVRSQYLHNDSLTHKSFETKSINGKLIYQYEDNGFDMGWEYVYNKREEWFDTLNGESLVKSLYHYDLSTSDTIISIGKEKDGKKIGTWITKTYSENKLVNQSKYPPFQFAVDTLSISYSETSDSIESIILVDTVNRTKLSINYKLSFISLDSTLHYIPEGESWLDAGQKLFEKRYFSNGNIFLIKDSSQFKIYYPNGILASDDVEFNVSAYKFWLDKQYLFRFDFENSVYGNGRNKLLDQEIYLMQPKISEAGNYTDITGEVNDRYVWIRLQGAYHLFDKKNNVFLKYNAFAWNEEINYGTSRFYIRKAAPHPAFIEVLVQEDNYDFIRLLDHSGKSLEVKDVGSFFAVNPNGTKLYTLNESSEGLALNCIDIELDTVIERIQIDTSGYFNAELYPEDNWMEFLNSDELFIKMFKGDNVFSISQKKFVRRIDLDYKKNHAKEEHEYRWDTQTKKNVFTIDLTVQESNGDLIKIEDSRVANKYSNHFYYYQKEKILYYQNLVNASDSDTAYLYNLESNKIDTIPHEILGVSSWGKSLHDLELFVQDGKKLFRYKPFTKEVTTLLNSISKINSVLCFENDLKFNANGSDYDVPIYGLKSKSDSLKTSIPLGASWEASFINQKFIINPAGIHSQESKHIYIPEDSSNIFFYNSSMKNRIERHVGLFPFAKKEYLFLSPDYYYMISKKGEGDEIYFVKDLTYYPFEQFDLKYNRPDIILDRLGYADSALVDAYHAAYQKRLKKMGFTEDMLQDDFHLPEIEIENFEEMPTLHDQGSIDIRLKIEDSKYKLDRINVWVNDVAVYGTDGISLRDKNVQKYSTTLSVDLAKGNNKVQVSVLNQAGAESYKETFEIECTAGKTEPNLYLITIGESEFEQADFNLTYAAKDAKDIAALFEKSSAYGEVKTKTLVNEEVTIENVIALKSFLTEADINDEVMIFIAGHGVLDANLDYFFATYDMDFQNPADKGLAYEDLESLLDGIKPLKKTLMIDACHSGEIDKDEVELAVADVNESDDIQFRVVGNTATPKLGSQNTSELTKSLFTDLRKGTGATIISSAGGMEFAMEGDDWSNGLFTYCFINGIKTKAADYDKNGEIWLSEIKKYVSEQVTLLSGGKQQPTARIENQMIDYRVW
ncbi:MAG: hypothetical protein ACI857_002185 [Arenicella sp.]|jgi:hypothetical protein